MSKAQLNQQTADFLDTLNLSERARDVIAETDFAIMHEVFGQMKSAEEVEEFVKENYSDGLVYNEYGVEIDYEMAVNMMDDDLREEIHGKLAPCTDQEFFDEYAKRHEEKFGEIWELAKENPCY